MGWLGWLILVVVMIAGTTAALCVVLDAVLPTGDDDEPQYE